MVKEGLTKEEARKLIESIKLLSDLKFRGMNFYSLTQGKEYITFKDGNGTVININIEDIPVISDKNNKDIIALSSSDNGNISIEDEVYEQKGGFDSFSSTTDSSSSIGFSSTSTSTTSSYSLKSSEKSKKMSGGAIYSDTSSNIPMNGGGVYSDTSSFNPKKSQQKYNNDVFSATSPNIPMNGGGAVFSATSDIYSLTSSLNFKNDMTGGNFSSDTIGSISYLKEHKNNLGTDIFKKSSQKGGSVGNPNELRNKMKELGIGSTSTSSVCE